MALNSQIQWTRHTWNPIWGCRKVSQGCKYCYAERWITGKNGQTFTDVRRTSADTWKQVTRIHNKLTGKEPFRERLVFTCSMSDFFIEEGDTFRHEMWQIIRDTPNLIYQILTKRPERIAAHLPADWGNGYPNVWLGTSVEDQANFKLRMPILADVPAVVRFLSAEPLIGPINLAGAETDIDWVIVGGESGFSTGKWQYRECKLEWIESLVNQGDEMGIPIFVKQLGTHLCKTLGCRDHKGGMLEDMPPQVQVRNFPRRYQPVEIKPVLQ